VKNGQNIHRINNALSVYMLARLVAETDSSEETQHVLVAARRRVSELVSEAEQALSVGGPHPT
jgi:two-component sensor histidine kinase